MESFKHNSYGTIEQVHLLKHNHHQQQQRKSCCWPSESATSRLLLLLFGIVFLVVFGIVVHGRHEQSTGSNALVKSGDLSNFWPIEAKVVNDAVNQLPKALYSKHGKLVVTLALQHKVLSYTIGDQTVQIDARTFNSSAIGPTLYVQPGDNLSILFINELGTSAMDATDSGWNTLHHPNSTSLHAHGLHVSPIGHADNVFPAVEPGKSRWYNYSIPLDHPRGHFWIHPHLHGSAALQVAYTMVSSLIVRDLKSEVEHSVLREVDADIVVAVQYLDLGSGKSSDYATLMKKSHSNINSYSSKSDINEPVQVLLANGAENPDYLVVEETGDPNVLVTRLRILNAAIDGTLMIQAEVEQQQERNKKFKEMYGCNTFQLGSDGVLFTHPRRVSRVVVPAGSRADILLRCPRQLFGSVVKVVSRKVDYHTQVLLGKDTKVLVGDVLRLTMNSRRNLKHKKRSKFIPVEFEVNKLPTSSLYHNTDLLEVPSDRVNRFVFRWTSGGKKSPKQVASTGETYTFYGVNGEAFGSAYDGSDKSLSVLTVKLGQVQEWVIVTDRNLDGSVATESHPFHLHTNHFQVVSSSRESIDYNVGDWRDTITSPSPGNVTIRWLPVKFTGISLAHCHTLVHEDTGMMIAFEIVE